MVADYDHIALWRCRRENATARSPHRREMARLTSHQTNCNNLVL